MMEDAGFGLSPRRVGERALRSCLLVLALSALTFCYCQRANGQRPVYQAQARRLIAACGGDPSLALGVVLWARDAGPERRRSSDPIAKALARPLDAVELRDLDHYLNAYEMVVGSSWPVYRFTQAMAAVYSALKWIDQITGRTELLGLVSGGRWRSNAPGASRASWSEFLAGWRGARDAYLKKVHP